MEEFLATADDEEKTKWAGQLVHLQTLVAIEQEASAAMVAAAAV